MHVVDISHPNFMEHIDSVNGILQEIESLDKPTIMVFNKIDAFTYEEADEFDLELTPRNYDLDHWKRSWMNKIGERAVFISAQDRNNIDELRRTVYRVASEIHASRFPFNTFFVLNLQRHESKTHTQSGYIEVPPAAQAG